MFFFDPLWLLLALPGLLLGMWAQIRVRGAFNKYIRGQFTEHDQHPCRSRHP